MAYNPNFVANTGASVPTTNVWDVGRLYEVDVNSDEFKELLVRLYQNVNNIALVVNLKDTAYYLNIEYGTNQQYYNLANPSPLKLRPGFREAVDIGALGAGVTAVNHGLVVTADWKWMKIYGAATISGTPVGYPLPFAGATGNNIEVTVTATQVVVNNQSGVVFTDSTVILEYVKS